MARAEWQGTWNTVREHMDDKGRLAIAEEMISIAISGLENYPYADKYAQDILDMMGAEVVVGDKTEPAGT